METIETTYLEQLENPSISEAEATALRTSLGSEKLEASYAGRIGKWIEPVIEPLGFDWKIGIALVTSFAAREVFVGTMATIYRVGEEDEGQARTLRELMMQETHPETGKPVYTPAVALALLIFYAFAMQCMSTLAVTKKETGSWKWTFIMLGYLTGLAYLASFATYQLLS